MSQLSDVIYVPNEEKYNTLHYGVHLKYNWDEVTLEPINMEKYTEYFARYRIEEFINKYAPELKEQLQEYLNEF